MCITDADVLKVLRDMGYDRRESDAIILNNMGFRNEYERQARVYDEAYETAVRILKSAR